jgi:signal transduction histidine kinase
MRGANAVRRRSVANPGQPSGGTGGVNGGQADAGGPGLLAGRAAGGDAAPAPAPGARRDTGSTGPQVALGQAAAAQGIHGGVVQGGQGAADAAGSHPAPGGGPAPGRARRQPGGRSRFALANWRVRWRLAAVIAVPTLTAAVLGSLQIYSDVSNWTAAGRVQHLAQLNTAVVGLSQALENERDLSAGYAADRAAGAALLPRLNAAQAATNEGEATVESLAAGVDTAAGYQPATVQNLSKLLDSLQDLPAIRHEVQDSLTPASKIILVYTQNIIQVANTFTGSVGSGANDATLEGDVTTLGALVQAENEASEQRGILFAALAAAPPVLRPEDLTTLEQASQQEQADQSAFDASTSTAEQQNLSNTVSGPGVDQAAAEEDLAETMASANPAEPLTAHGLTAGQWYAHMSATVDDMRAVADELTGSITSQADSLRSRAAEFLLITSVVTLALLLLVLAVSTIVARSLIRPLRKLRTDALDVAGHRLPEMVRRLSQSEGLDESVEIEPIGVTSTDEIGEVARAFDQVHREAVRLAADEAMLRGNLNAMFINLSRRSQSLIERQLSLIDSLEQSEQDPGRLASLFRLDHLATRMRRNSENLLVLAGHEVTRRWSQPVPLVDVLRAAISEIEQYERVVLNVQPGIVVVGQAVNDVVHLVAEIVENATTFSPEDTQVYVSGQPLSSGGVLLDITDNGVGISDQEMSHANWRLDNPPVVDVAVSRRMGLFVVGRLAARHGVRVRLRHAQAGGLTALIWLPDTVAAPEVAPPLGRLRRFEADDYGPAQSLSAPTQAVVTGPAATAARIPRFSPTSPAVPSPPSFTSSPGGVGDPGAASPAGSGPGAAQVPGTPGVPVGTGPQRAPGDPGAGTASGAHGVSNWDVTGTNRDAAGAGWAPGGGRDSRDNRDAAASPPLPVRNGNGKPATPASGSASPATGLTPATGPTPATGLTPAGGATPANGADPANGGPDPRNGYRPDPAAAPGPSRLPSFTGLGGAVPQFPAGSQGAHGSDGPGAAGPASAGPGPGGARPGLNGGGNADPASAEAAGPGQVTIPPAGQEQRLPIFDSLESDWFRRSGTALPAAPLPPADGTPSVGQAGAQPSWTSPADAGWRAAEVVAAPAAGETTQAGLPRRVPRANLVPGSVGSGAGQEAVSDSPARSADAARSRMASFQRGVREGRAAAPQIEEPQDQ